MAGDVLIKIRNLRHVYNPGTPEEVLALDGISLEIREGEFVAIVGANGSGKSTLAKHLNALLLPTEGEVLIAGMDTRRPEYLWEIRQQVGMVFQNPDNQIVATVVEEDVAFGPENLGLPPEEIRRRVEEALRAVHLEELRHHEPHLLSGGQKQRVAIAGILAMRPRCIVLDEATSMLDPQGQQEVLATVRRLNAEGITIVFITHSMDEAALASRVLVMDKGHIVLDGPPQEVFSKPAELRRLHLNVPQAVQLAELLRQEGLPIPRGIVTPGELVEAIWSLVPRFAKAGNWTLASLALENSRKAMQGNEQTAITCEDVHYIYLRGTPMETVALRGVNLRIPAGEATGIIGPTGSGKSTLIQHFNGLLRPTAGRIWVDSIELPASGAVLRELRQKVGLVFQYPEHQLFEETVYDDVAFGPRNMGLGEEEVSRRVRQALELVGLDPGRFGKRSPFSLSEGEMRRVAIAGVLAMDPRVLVLDEPTAGLDPRGREEILAHLQTLRAREEVTVIVVSHSIDELSSLTDRVAVLHQGRVYLEGTTREVFSQGKRLAAIGLRVPVVAEVLEKLRERGLPVRTDVLTVEEAKETILKGLKAFS
ncbi:MAG: energy-coupling factor transporter ATPase [Armatimonadota bacterium]|nr:energy-coupling factor transporter ATPase [Armatimonadota bacterium]MDR7435476.1 energy-coupling factor transporter ATPase [Armatimonadota bacterium]